MTTETILETIDANLPAATERLFDFLRIKSISTDPSHAEDCRHAAQWLCGQLRDLGFEASLRETPGHPIVVGHAQAKRPDAPHVLFYGHYDVQPPDPEDLWTVDAFQPRLVAGEHGEEIVARGASDDKGQLMTFLEACRAFQANGGLPCHIVFLFEGEEETGSPSLPGFFAANRDELRAADLALVCDTSMWNHETPAITTMLRGLAQEEMVISVADRDLHSGMFGGPVLNPIHVVARIVADLHDAEGRVTLPGFYDGVAELPEEIAAQWRALEFDETAFLKGVGVSRPAGEAGRSVMEKIWSRPTCDVNGIYGGYMGPGAKTVLPAKAGAKFSFRLVGRQDPQKILDGFRAFARERLPAEAHVEFVTHGASPALQLPFESEALTRARRALGEEWGKEAALVGCGGSIPIVGAFKEQLGLDALMIGFALEDDRIHSPNEKYAYDSFHKGTRSWARVLAALAA